MDAPNQPIDEYTLAAFIAGTLPDDRRDELVAYLAQSADARELLQMAYEALEASKRVDEPLAFPAAAPPRGVERRERTPAPSRPAAPSRAHRVLRYAAVAVLMFSIGLSLNLFLGDDTDVLRSTTAETDAVLDVRVAEGSLALHWTVVPDAYQYRVVVFDPETAEVVARYETSENELAAETPFPAELRDRLEAGRTYQFRIDAFDVQNRRLQSATLDVVPE